MSGTKGILWTLGLVFAVTFATQLLATGFDVFNMDVSAVQAAANSAIAAVLAFLINYLSPNITRYGIGSDAE